MIKCARYANLFTVLLKIKIGRPTKLSKTSFDLLVGSISVSCITLMSVCKL
jgi:hypothetical protein